jgi:hypothetical protein
MISWKSTSTYKFENCQVRPIRKDLMIVDNNSHRYSYYLGPLRMLIEFLYLVILLKASSRHISAPYELREIRELFQRLPQVGRSRSEDVGQPGDAHPTTLTQDSQATFQGNTLIHVVGTPFESLRLSARF